MNRQFTEGILVNSHKRLHLPVSTQIHKGILGRIPSVLKATKYIINNLPKRFDIT